MTGLSLAIHKSALGLKYKPMFMLIIENEINTMDIILRRAKSDPYLDHVPTVTGSNLSSFFI